MPRPSRSPSPRSIANTIAWLALIALAALAALAVVIVLRLGPLGLVLLGLMTLFVCSQFSLSDEAPTWGTEVFKARMSRPMSLEQRAAMQAERQSALSPLRFYRWCGVLLTVAGALAFAWQQMQP